MQTGYVQHFRTGQAYGFIKPSGGGVDIFFHIKNCVRIPREGDEVSFAIAPDDRHPERTAAVDVAPLEREGA